MTWFPNFFQIMQFSFFLSAVIYYIAADFFFFVWIESGACMGELLWHVSRCAWKKKDMRKREASAHASNSRIHTAPPPLQKSTATQMKKNSSFSVAYCMVYNDIISLPICRFTFSSLQLLRATPTLKKKKKWQQQRKSKKKRRNKKVLVSSDVDNWSLYLMVT